MCTYSMRKYWLKAGLEFHARCAGAIIDGRHSFSQAQRSPTLSSPDRLEVPANDSGETDFAVKKYVVEKSPKDIHAYCAYLLRIYCNYIIEIGILVNVSTKQLVRNRNQPTFHTGSGAISSRSPISGYCNVRPLLWKARPPTEVIQPKALCLIGRTDH